MRLASYVLSLCLHLAAFLLIWFWPGSPPIKLDAPPVMISLVDGAPGGNRTPSPIMGHMGEPGDGPLAPTPPAPKNEIAAPAREEVKEPTPVPAAPREAAPIKRPEPLKEPQKPAPVKEEATPVAQKKEEKPKKEEQPRKEEAKPAEKPKKQEKKEEPKKPTKEAPKKQAPKEDPVAAALKQARRKASSRADSGDRGNAIEQALAQAQRRAGGNRGGGGGEGDGPGGGGLGNTYMGQVMLAVRPNWSFNSARRVNLSCVIKVRVDMQGNVLQADVSQSSGNALFDTSAVNSVLNTSRAGQFPPPPSPEYTELDLVFSFDELMMR